jgi:hypothetical protein
VGWGGTVKLFSFLLSSCTRRVTWCIEGWLLSFTLLTKEKKYIEKITILCARKTFAPIRETYSTPITTTTTTSTHRHHTRAIDVGSVCCRFAYKLFPRKYPNLIKDLRCLLSFGGRREGGACRSETINFPSDWAAKLLLAAGLTVGSFSLLRYTHPIVTPFPHYPYQHRHAIESVVTEQTMSLTWPEETRTDTPPSFFGVTR